MGKIDERLAELGLDLPDVFASPTGAEFRFEYVRVSAGLAYVSGHGPMDGSRTLFTGKVDAELQTEPAYEAARATALSILASLKADLGDLDRVTRWVKLTGFVNASPGFTGTPGVVNGASDLIRELWGDHGRHARSAIGVGELPFGWPVEIEAIAEVES